VAWFVTFDLYHTLVHGAARDWERAVAEAAAIVGVDQAALLAAYHDTWRQRQVGWDCEQTMRILAERAGGRPSQAQVTQAAAIRRAVARQVLSAPLASTIQALDALRAAGYRLGLVSNATADTAEAWPGCDLAARFDAAMFSCDVGAAKPDHRIYLAATMALGSQPGECWYVGDGADDELAAAAVLGMTAVRTTQHSDSDPSWPGITISSLTDLPGLLPAHPEPAPAGGHIAGAGHPTLRRRHTPPLGLPATARICFDHRA
jgi:putative hydrolase of the HAD superfamily